MSGSSRAITLSLSVRDADVVRTQLLAMGEAGERALTRLDAAAQRATGGGGALSQISTSTQTATRDFGGFRNAVQSGGYQLQDFAVQVQGGTSALTALSQQGSQFLGVFGPAGAVAGAVLTVGLLAYQLLEVGDNGDEAAKGVDALSKAMEQAARDAERVATVLARVEARFMSVIEAGRQQRIRTLNTDVAELSRLENDATLRSLNRGMAGSAAANEAASLRGQLTPEYGLSFTDQENLRRRITELEGTAASAMADADNARREAARFAFNRQRTEGLVQGEVQGDANPNPGTLDRDTPERRASGSVDRSDPTGAVDRLRNQRATALEREIDQLTRSVETPIERYQRRLEELTDVALRARSEGNPIPDETISRSADAALAEFERLERGVEQTSTMGRELGMTFSSAFEDAILKGKSFREVLEGIIQDLARIVLRQTVTAPLGNAISQGIQGFDWSKLLPFADGGIMTANGPVPLRRYAGGGIANTPQLAMFGEGSTAEAYVPLPDGRRIPVAMQGGGGMTFAPTYNIDARGADASMIPRLRAEMVAIARASNAELLDNIQRGGSAARIVGRRA